MPPGHEALGLRVVYAVNEAHEFGHNVAVIPRRPNVFSATAQRSGKMTKSILAVPALSDGEVRTV